MNEQLPLEQLIAHRREPFQLFFATRAVEVVPESDDYLLEPEGDGLRLHAANEAALELPRQILREAFGDELNFTPVTVKLQQHDDVTYEPVMYARTEVPATAQPPLRAALLARGATILEEEEDVRRAGVVTRAVCPLRQLLGFPETLHKLGGEGAKSWIWISHYAPASPAENDTTRPLHETPAGPSTPD